MSEANGQILVSGTTGRVLVHPTTGNPLYGIQGGVPQWCGVISPCTPDLLCDYNVLILPENVVVSVAWWTGGMFSYAWQGNGTGTLGQVNIWYVTTGVNYRWNMSIALIAGGTRYLRKYKTDIGLCYGPEGSYTPSTGTYSAVVYA